MDRKKYLSIISHYETCLEKYGDSHLGVDWPNKNDADLRYRIMLEVIRPTSKVNINLLDFGCGASHLYEYIVKNNLVNKINYSGLDISEKFIKLSKEKFPYLNYYCMDILDNPINLPEFDYIIMNGVFTEKRELSYNDMFLYFMDTIQILYPKSLKGMAFNVMSKQVDWERDDLFHLSFDILADFLSKKISRNFIIRNDYGLYEYCVYLYR
jgi:SAM-dependent methyltransferase